MAYDRVVTDLNAARLRGTSYPIVHALISASLSVNHDVSVSPPASPSFMTSLVRHRQNHFK